ncbi:MAG TPA: acetyl ornithine aminotransferase family protein [Rhodanobacteraceae bacterium]|nr:acetyl ornithine aminotransferase family protein [Rhodanobacteraceae bacterium]
MKTPHIKTALPGPKAEAMLKRDSVVVSPSYPRDYPFVISHAKGAEAWDVDGNRFLDFMAGIAVTGTGHSHPKVVQAITEAAQKFVHISSDYWHENQIALAEKISALNPVGGPAMRFFCQSGTEAVEAAIKLARNVSGRGRFIAFLGGFHGRTMGSLSFTASKYTQQKGFFPTMPGVTHVPYPNPYRPLFAGSDQGAAVLNYIENMLFRSNLPPSEVAAILIEPLQGEGGYLVPPDGFLKGLRELCDRHGILLIFDEVQSGIGRTGKMFAAEHSGVVPDIMTLAKGLGSGLPIGMAVAKRQLMERWQRGSHGNTYGGNPVCCAAALATLDLVSSEYCANAARVGEYFIGKLRELQNKYACIGEVRGKGLMLGMELVEDRTTKAPATKLTEKLIRQCYQNGMLLLSCGVSTIRFMPPLMINKGHVDEAITILDASLGETQNA